MADVIYPIEYSREVLASFCDMWNIPIETTEQNPEVALHILNTMWGIPIIEGPQSARKPHLDAIGRVVAETFTHSYSRPFIQHVGTKFGQIQATPFLFHFEARLFTMSEADLIEIFDNVKGFTDTHSGIAKSLVGVGIVGGLKGLPPSEIVQGIGNRAVAGGEAIAEAAAGRASRAAATSRVGGLITRLGALTSNAGTALATGVGASIGAGLAAIYVLTIGEGYEKLEDIRNVATIRYRNNEISEATFRHIMSFHPTDVSPELYHE